MNNKMILAIVAITISIVGCDDDQTPVQPRVPPTPEQEFQVERLFTVEDGCTVYRFYDGGYHRYFTDCSGSVDGRHTSGKSSTPDNITTGTAQ